MVGAVSASNIGTSAITAVKIAAGFITSTQIQAGSISGSSIAADAITATQIAAGTITSAEIMAGAISASNMAADVFKTSNYAEFADGIPSSGSKMDMTGDALKVAFGSVKMGYRGSIYNSGAYPSASIVLVSGSVGIASGTLNTGGMTRVAKVTFAHPMADATYQMTAQSRNYVGYDFYIDGKTTGSANIMAVAVATGANTHIDTALGNGAVYLDFQIIKLW